jgi:hypothetical protein
MRAKLSTCACTHQQLPSCHMTFKNHKIFQKQNVTPKKSVKSSVLPIFYRFLGYELVRSYGNKQNVFVSDGWIMESGHSKNFLAGESVTAGFCESLHQTLPATHVAQAGAEKKMRYEGK